MNNQEQHHPQPVYRRENARREYTNTATQSNNAHPSTHHAHQNTTSQSRRQNNNINSRQRFEIAQAEWVKLFQTRQDKETRDGQRPIVLTQYNQRENAPWGDTLQAKENNTTRVYSLNLNGISLDRRGGQFDTLCSVAKEIQADIICCQEHNVDTSKPIVRSILYDTLRQHWSRFRLQTGSTPQQFTHWYKPGGTLMFSIGNITGRLQDQKQDHMGRWVTQTMKGQNGTQVTFISAYQPVRDTASLGLMTVVTQQRNILTQMGDQVREPRKAFKRDLRILLQELTTRGDDILLVGDFNETIDAQFNGLCKLIADFHLVDLMQGRSHSPYPATYARGKQRLDYGFATEKVANALRSAGYEAFNERFPTDHRAYYFDFDTEKLFGNETQSLAPPAMRILKSSNINQVTQYLREKYRQLENCNAFRRGDQLEAPGNRDMQAERLDKDVLRASLSAEMRSQKYQQPAWSTALAKARIKVVVLTKCLSMVRTGRDCIEAINSHLDKGIFSDSLAPTTKHECVQQLRNARREVRKIVKESYARREEEQQAKIAELEASSRLDDQEQAKIIRRIKRAEALKRLFETLNRARTSSVRQGVTQLEIPKHPQEDPKTCTEWQIIDIPTEIVEHLQKRNRQHFGQAHGTPFTVPPLSRALEFTGEGQGANEILSGTWEQPAELSESVRLLLQHIQITEDMANILCTDTISDEEFVGKLKVWKETTTTSPSGVHLGHYKSLISRHKYSHVKDDNEDTENEVKVTELRDEMNHIQQAIRRLHLQLINYALSRGYSYQRWQQVANTILFKERNNIKIHRTRVIHLYEADYNLILGLKWRAALYQSEVKKKLHDGQFGSRPRRNAIDPVMLEELQFEISRASRKMFLQTNYDASACYDRIIPNLAMLASRKYGVHEHVTLSNARTLEHAAYHIRTEMGLSETSYSHSEHFPIYGTGQGSGNSPMIWCFISSLLYECYGTTTHAATYYNPDHTNPIRWSMIGFVDDSNGQVNVFSEEDSVNSLAEMHKRAQHNAQEWAKLLGATGGALELPKCSYHLLYWRFSIQGAPVLANCPHEYRSIEVTDPHSSTPQVLEYLTPHSAHKTLGHYKEPAGTQITQFNQLKKKSDAITKFLWSTHLSRAESWLYYHACYLPAICYPLTSSHLSYQQCEKVQRTAMSIIVARCGYNRNTKREVLYGPVEYGGANFTHLYIQQGYQQVKYFLRQWRSDTSVGKMLQCVLAWTQMAVGTSYSILENTTTKLPHMEVKWIASLRNFLAYIKARLLLHISGVPTIQRQGDSFIMDHVLESHKFSAAEIRKINYCRLYLQAITISDISTATGDALDLCKLVGTMSLQSSRTTWIPINQDRPSEAEWRLWRRANLLWSTPEGRLHVPLKKWERPIHTQRNSHFAYRKHNKLWIRNQDNTYQRYRIQHLDDANRTNKVVSRDAIPSTATPIEVTLHDRGHWQITHPGFHISTTRVVPSAIATFDAYIETLDPWEVDLLRHISMDVDPFTVCLEAQTNFRAVSDGSALPTGSASFGWILSTRHGERIVEGMGPVRGMKVHSYRAEACGVLSLLRFLIQVANFTQMHDSWQGVLATDSQSLLDTLLGQDNCRQNETAPVDLDHNRVVLDVLCPEWDVLIEIQNSLKLLPGVHLEYVEGHQDDKTPYHNLPLLAQLNVDADKIAGQYHEFHFLHLPFVILSPHTRAHLVMDEGTVTSKYEDTIRMNATGPPLLEYICGKHNWTGSITESINWTAHGLALKRNKQRRSHIVKFIHDILPTTGLRNKFDGGKRTCPLCTCRQEDRDHILRCPHPSRELWRNQFIDDIQQHCQDSKTYPHLQRLLLSALSQWLEGEDHPHLDPGQYPSDIHQLIRQQNRIGWRHLWLGRFAKEWSKVQVRYHEMQYPTQQNASERWQVNLISKIWDKWHKLWLSRNSELFGKDEVSRRQAEQKEVRRQLTEIYSQRGMMEPSVQALLLETPEAHDKHPIHVTKNWILTHASTIAESVKRVKTRALTGVRSIRSYFHSIQSA